MSSRTSTMAFEATRQRLIAERAAARSILQNYWENPAAIGEHPDLPEEIYKATCTYAEANDRLNALSAIMNHPVLPHVRVA